MRLLNAAERLGSQQDGFGEDPLSQVGGEGLLRHHVDRTTDQVFQVLLQSHEIQERAPFSEGYQQVEVAGVGAFTARQRAEDAHVPRPMAFCRIEDLHAVPLQHRVAH